MKRAGRIEPPADGGVAVAIRFADGTAWYLHGTDRDAVRRRVLKASKSGVVVKLQDARLLDPEAARQVVAVEPATPEEVAAMERRYTDDCRRGPRWWHGRQRRAQVVRSDVKLTNPEGARREPDAARARRGQAALEALVRELRERAT